MPGPWDFVHTQFILRIPKPTASFVDKTVIVTGANGDIGKETARHIIRLGASKVILGCRSASRGNKAKRELENDLKCSPKVIEVWEVDLESPASVRTFVDRANTLPRLDVLINNAGIRAAKFEVSYGTERTLAVNVIGTFLLAVQMIPKLKETARKYGVTPHMTFVSSALYDIAKYPETDGGDIFTWFTDESHVDGKLQYVQPYGLSKLLQLYATLKLSATVAPGDDASPTVIVNSLDPCFCKSGLHSALTGAVKVGVTIFAAVAGRSPEEGARLVVQAASAGKETHGMYMRGGEVRPYVGNALDEKKAAQVWDVLCRKLEGLQPGILRNLD